MSTLLYHLTDLPNVGSKQYHLLPDQLKPVLAGTGWTCLMNCLGPGNRNGTLLTPHSGEGGKAASVQFKPEEQTWIDVLNPDGKTIYSIGYWNAEPPVPKDLARGKVINGIQLELNGQNWTIPVLHPVYATIPKQFVRVAGGIAEKFKAEYQGICQTAESFLNRKREEWYWKDLVEFCSDVLSVNYRIGEWEAINVLEIMDNESVPKIVEIALGYRSLALEIEAQKKSTELNNG